MEKSAALRAVLKLRYEELRDTLVDNPSPEVSGKAQEIRNLMKMFKIS